jgi:hypothetical protein
VMITSVFSVDVIITSELELDVFRLRFLRTPGKRNDGQSFTKFRQLSPVSQGFVLSTTRNRKSELQYISHTRTRGCVSEDQVVALVSSRSDWCTVPSPKSRFRWFTSFKAARTCAIFRSLSSSSFRVDNLLSLLSISDSCHPMIWSEVPFSQRKRLETNGINNYKDST